MDDIICTICSGQFEPGDTKTCLQAKGCAGVNDASRKRGDSLVVTVGQYIHKKCRSDYINPNYIAKYLRDKNKDVPEQEKVTLRSSESAFSYQNDCIFCGRTITDDKGRKRQSDMYYVRTRVFDKTVLSVCDERGDEWAEKVRRRIQMYPSSDLHAADVIYHQNCNTNFRIGRQLPSRYAGGNTFFSTNVSKVNVVQNI